MAASRRAGTIALCLALLALVLAPGAASAQSGGPFAPLDRPGPDLSVPAPALAASLHCSSELAADGRRWVLLSPATGVTPAQNYAWNWEKSLTAAGIPWCAVTMPEHTLGDIQVAGEHLVDAIRTMHARTGQRIAILGHSQGGMSMRWALRFWPDTRAMVDDVIGIAPTNHGTRALDLLALGCRLGCVAASWQQGADSAFMAALNSGAETFAGISYTTIATRFDEVVLPSSGPRSVSALRTGDGAVANTLTQDVCPRGFPEHLLVGTVSPAAYAIAMDALRHPGPADVARVDRSVCDDRVQPGVDPRDVTGYLRILQSLPGLLAVPFPVNVVGVPVLKAEPPLRCYVYAAGC
jgi:hypothetical protein